MLIRRATTYVATLAVAIIVAFAVPVSQLRTMSVIKMCCCPDPDHCKCPDHGDTSTTSSMRACHSTQHTIVAPQLPAFTSPVIAIAAAPVATIIAFEHMTPAPHPAPPPIRPDAPS